MSTTALLLFAVTTSPGAPTDAELLAKAEAAFRDGTQMRDDAIRARAAFRTAATAYDGLWERGNHTAELALNRAHAHRLSGNLDLAIVALHEGLAVTPWERSLQVALEDARSAVDYPITGDLAAQCRPPPLSTIGTRMSPTEAWLIGGALWFVVCFAVARFAMTRRPLWLSVTGVSLVAVAVLGGLWWQDHRERSRLNQHPLVVVTEDVVLRTGNHARTYPPRLDQPLPRGVEARELTRRGGWVQVELVGGAVGWLPERAIRRVDSPETGA